MLTYFDLWMWQIWRQRCGLVFGVMEAPQSLNGPIKHQCLSHTGPELNLHHCYQIPSTACTTQERCVFHHVWFELRIDIATWALSWIWRLVFFLHVCFQHHTWSVSDCEKPRAYICMEKGKVNDSAAEEGCPPDGVSEHYSAWLHEQQYSNIKMINTILWLTIYHVNREFLMTLKGQFT